MELGLYHNLLPIFKDLNQKGQVGKRMSKF